MSKKCLSCGSSNDDEMAFCRTCGEPLDADLRLVKDIEAMSKRRTVQPEKPVGRTREDDDFVIHPPQEEKKKSAALWILLGLLVAAAAAVCLWLLLR